MDKHISLMMTKIIWTVDTEDTIERAMTMLATHRLSAIPVVDQKGIIFGIISPLDILRFHESRQNPKAARVWEFCTHKPISVIPETPIVDVAKLMIKNKINHVLITENGVPLGIVSAANFIEQYILDCGAGR